MTAKKEGATGARDSGGGGEIPRDVWPLFRCSPSLFFLFSSLLFSSLLFFRYLVSLNLFLHATPTPAANSLSASRPKSPAARPEARAALLPHRRARRANVLRRQPAARREQRRGRCFSSVVIFVITLSPIFSSFLCLCQFASFSESLATRVGEGGGG